ncbi:MAG: diguanylate cyclase (GGDEF)-like protein [Pseudohongiellaceae bacterium]|jgi:diguanylate cyclase (GGDEF)-like protein
MENETLSVALALVAIICSLALFINWSGYKHIPGLFNIAVGFSITSAGILLLSTQQSLHPWISIMLANGLILGGRIPLLIGLASFWNQGSTKLSVFTAFLYALAMAGFFYFTFVEVSPLGRIRIYTALMLVFNLSYIFIIVKGMRVETKMRPVTSINSSNGSFLALMLFSFNTVTEIILMYVRSDASLLSADEGTSILLLGSIFTMIVFAFAIIIMTMEELTLEHKENSIYDPITTILNHRTFLEVGNRVMGIALRYSKPVTLLTLEIENMEEVVAKFGYKTGNEMLRHFSQMASDRRRNEDVLARSSYKEFRMLLPGVDEEGSKVVIGKIYKALQAEQFAHKNTMLEIKVNLASITRREEDLDLQQMLQEGEIELYRIKMAKQELVNII